MGVCTRYMGIETMGTSNIFVGMCTIWALQLLFLFRTAFCPTRGSWLPLFVFNCSIISLSPS